jgi:hypothetical protein
LGLIISVICTNLGILESIIEAMPIPINILPAAKNIAKDAFFEILTINCLLYII